MDLDKNSYPDVAVGSLSDSVTVFRCVKSMFNTWVTLKFFPFELKFVMPILQKTKAGMHFEDFPFTSCITM